MAKAQIDLGVGGGGAYKGSFILDASSKTVPLPFEVTLPLVRQLSAYQKLN